MTSNIRILLAQIATFEAQHRAGLNPPVTALAEFFDTARLARLDVDSFDRELREQVPPAPTRRVPLALEELDPAVKVQFDIPLPVLARAVMDELARVDRAAARAATRTDFVGMSPASV